MQADTNIRLTIISCALLSACSETIEWKEEILLSVGQRIVVTRSVERIPAELGHRRATSYEMDAKYPDTGKKLNWEGSFGVGPIMLEFKDGQAFVVAMPVMCDAKIKEFRVKEFPYIFMRSQDGKNWKVIAPNELPSEFKKANLTASYDEYRIGKGEYQSYEAISKGNIEAERSSEGFVQVNIPRSPEEWNFKFNKAFKGCAQQR